MIAEPSPTWYTLPYQVRYIISLFVLDTISDLISDYCVASWIEPRFAAMATMALSSPIQQTHAKALALSQEAPHHLRKYTASKIPFPIPFVSSPESAELWTTYERVLLSCLRTGDDKSAFLCLEKLIERFGASNERVMGLRGLYQESVAEDTSALEKILREYDRVLREDPTNAVRALSLLFSLSGC